MPRPVLIPEADASSRLSTAACSSTNGSRSPWGGGTWENIDLYKVYGDLIDNATDPERGAQDHIHVWFDDAAIYDHIAAAEAPAIEPLGGVFSGDQEVMLSSATAAARLHYTLDGSAPDVVSPALANGASLVLSDDAQLRVVAMADGLLASAISSADFAFPTIHRAIGVDHVQGAVWTCSPAGARSVSGDATRFEDLDGKADCRLLATGTGDA